MAVESEGVDRPAAEQRGAPPLIDTDTFLTTRYVLVDDDDKTQPALATAPGPEPALSRSEGVTVAIVGQWAQFPSERAFYRSAERHLRTAFPTLPARSQFNRLLRPTHDRVVGVSQWLVGHLSGSGPAGHAWLDEVLDTTGVPVRHARRRGQGWRAGQADGGSCTRLGWDDGRHRLSAVSSSGGLTGVGAGPASADDRPLAAPVLAVRQVPQGRMPEVGSTRAGGSSVVETGLEGRQWLPRWRPLYQAPVVCPPQRAQAAPAQAWPRARRRWAAGRRAIVETVHARLLVTFRLEHERPHTLSGFRARLAAKVALPHFCCWLNHQLGRPLLAFADLVDW